MNQDNALSINATNSFLLKEEIKILEHELQIISHKLESFEGILRSNLTDQIIEEQELTALYKKLKKEKKAQRLKQKKRGKNYFEPIGLEPIPKKKVAVNKDDEKEKKRLYREALLHVHPDKFSLNSDKIELATDVSSKLIEIYQTGNLLELQDYHAHIFSGNALDIESTIKPTISSQDDVYLKKQIQKLKQQIIDLKNKHTYIVLTEYKEPLDFLEELKTYYADRLLKLRKRTRKA